MSDHRRDRRAYLARVAGDLRLPDDITREVLEELDGHLAESIASLLDAGLTADQAERESIARLGDPGELATGIRHARQTRRRLLVAVGYGVWDGAKGALWGYLFGIAVAILASMLAGIGLYIAASIFHVGPTGWDTFTPMFVIIYVVLAAGVAGRRVPSAIAGRAAHRISDVARPVAVIGGIGLAVVTIFFVRTGLDLWTVAALVMLPFGFGVGAWAANGPPRTGRVGISSRWLVAIVMAVAVALVLVNVATPRRSADGEPAGESANIGPPASDVLGEAWVESSSSWRSGAAIELSITFEPPDALSGWRDLRVEVWPSMDGPDGRVGMDPAATGPTLSVPLIAVDGGSQHHADVQLPATKTQQFFSTVTTGIAPDGRRYVLTGPDGPTASSPWVGTVWEYLTTP